MAVHVVRDYGDNNWKTELAKTALSWIGDAIKQSRQSTENAKQAILFDQVLNGGGGGQAQTPPQPTGTQTGDTSLLGGSQLGSIAAPNRDGWGEAFRSGGNPLAEFDAGISSVLPSSAQGLGTQSNAPSTQTNIPTQTEMLQRIAAAYANPRFSKWLNPKTVNELFAPYLQANEAARLEQARKALGDILMRAPDAASRVAPLWRAYAEGTIPLEAVTQGQAQAVADRPTLTQVDLGGSINILNRNPITGEITPAWSGDRTLTPQEVATNDLARAKLAEEIRHAKVTEGQRDRELTYNERPKVQQVSRLDDGRTAVIMTDGSTRILTPEAAGLTTIERDYIGGLETRRKALAEQYSTLLKQQATAQKNSVEGQPNPELDGINAAIKNVLGEIEKIDTEINGIYQRKLESQQPASPLETGTAGVGAHSDVGISMLGDHPQVSITTPFGTQRTKSDGSTYTHWGVDYAVPNGSKIYIPDLQGTQFRVNFVGNDEKGYGHYADLEGTYVDENGKPHTIKFRVAHLSQISVKPGQQMTAGDVIGLSGNSGNSRGKNGGYHLHLEMSVDGKPVDPAKIKGMIPSVRGRATTGGQQGQQPQGQGQQPQGQQGQGQQRQPQSTRRHYSAGGYGSGYPAFIYPNYSAGNTQQTPTPINRDVAAQTPQGSQLPPTVSGDVSIPTTTSDDRTILPSSLTSGDTHAPASDDRAILPPSPASGDVSAPTSGDRTILPPSPTSSDVTAPNAASITSGDTAPEVTGTSFMGIDLPGLNPSGAPSASTLPMGMTGGAPTPQTVDPDGGLTSYRVPNDNSPITWVNASGKPMLTSDRQLFTRQVYEDLAQQADAGHFRDRGISNRADLDKWLQSVGMRPNNPSEQRGIDALNGDTARIIEAEDPAITPTTQTPRDNPDRYPAPEFTDRINGTTPEALQGQLNALNGLTDDRYSQWTKILRGMPPGYGTDRMQTLPLTPEGEMRSRGDGLLHYYRTGDRYGLQGGRDASYRVGYDGPPIDPNNPMEGQPFTLLGLDRGTTPAPNSGVTPFSLSGGTAPEETGTTFGDIELPGLEQPGEMTASRKPMGRGRPRRRAAPAPTPRRRRRAAPRRGGTYTSYEEQRTAVDGSARRHGVAPELVRAVIQTESSWDPNATGPKTKWGRAKGLMQLIDDTARELGVRNSYDPAQNIEGGTKYLARLIRRYKGDISKALMAYHCGPNNVDKGRIPQVSRDYARKVLGIYRQLGGR